MSTVLPPPGALWGVIISQNFLGVNLGHSKKICLIDCLTIQPDNPVRYTSSLYDKYL